MKSKESYTPQEVVSIAEAYHRIKTASYSANPCIKGNNSDIGLYHFEHTHLPEFNRDVPSNVRFEMKDISNLVDLIQRVRKILESSETIRQTH